MINREKLIWKNLALRVDVYDGPEDTEGSTMVSARSMGLQGRRTDVWIRHFSICQFSNFQFLSFSLIISLVR